MYRKGHAIMSTIAAMTSKRCVSTRLSCLKPRKAELEGRKPLQRLAEKAPPVAGKRRGATLVPFLLDHACHPCERGGADRRRPAVPRYVLAQAAGPFLASIIIQETCRERSCRG